MKSITKLLIASSSLILVLFLWKEIPDLSIHKKINADKVSSFFTALASLLTAVTVYLLYKQIQEQIEDRKAANRPDLFPLSTDYNITRGVDYIHINRRSVDTTDFSTNVVQLHNIGSGVAKEIVVKWQFDMDSVIKDIPQRTLTHVINDVVTENYDFIQSNNFIDIFIPSLYIASFSKYDQSTTKIWDKLLLELTYKDISDHEYKKFFQVTVKISTRYAEFKFKSVNNP